MSQAGAGGAIPSGTWKTSGAANWNSNATGVGIPSAWVAGNNAVFAAGNDATGAYTVTVSGTVQLAGLTIEEGTITQTGGTLDFGTTPDAVINVASGATWSESDTSHINGTGGLVKTGGGTLILRGNNNFLKAAPGNQAYLTIEDGVVDIGGDGTLGDAPLSTNLTSLTLDGGTLRSSGPGGGISSSRSVFIASNGGTFDLPSVDDFAILGSMSGSGTITKTGVGQLILRETQTTFAGKYVAAGGSIAVYHDSDFGPVPSSVQPDYFTLNGGSLSGIYNLHETIDPNRGITIASFGGYLYPSNAGLDFNGMISGTQGGKLTIGLNDSVGTATTGQVGLGGSSTYDGATQIDSGAVLAVKVLANGGVSSGIGASSSAATNLILNGGTLTYTGTGASSDRNFTLTSAGGTIAASGASNAALTFTSTAPIAMSGSGARKLTLRGSSAGDNVMSLAIVDHGSDITTLATFDGATWILKNTGNSYSGVTDLDAGRLKLGASGVIPDSSVVETHSSGSIFDLNGFDETVRSVQAFLGQIALGTKTLTVNNPNGETVSAKITGVGGGRLVKNGNGKWTLDPMASSAYDGGVTVNGGALGVGSAVALGSGTLVVNNTATLGAIYSTAMSLTNSVTLNGNLTFDDTFTATPGAITWAASGTNKWTISGASRTLTVNSAAGGYQVAINQVISQDAAGRGLTKAGNGTLVLGGANTYTGNTEVDAGTLTISSAFLADAADVHLENGSKFQLSFSGADVIRALFINGVSQATGTWGGPGSGASHISSLLSGSGTLQVSTVVPPSSLPGDFNSDGKVDASDYVFWRNKLGTNSGLPNDNGLGGPVGQADFDLWRTHFGQHAGSGDTLLNQKIPEPSMASLISIAVAMGFIRRRRPNQRCQEPIRCIGS